MTTGSARTGPLEGSEEVWRMGEVVLRADHVSKRFPGVLALDKVGLDLRRGEVHAVCGENGAGKSTLMKIITGLYQHDEGTVTYKGVERRFASIQDAERVGIAMIHQELNLIPHLDVAENIFLAREPRKGPFVDKERMIREARRFLERLHIDISPTIQIRKLTVAKQQMVEIAKALSLNAEVLIMDEPTSSLTESEIESLFSIIHELKAAGVSIFYISHRLEELRYIVDRVTVLRDGRFISTKNFADTSVDGIVAEMVGRSLDDVFPPRTSSPTNEVILEVSGLSKAGVFENIGFDLRRGEILGFAGLMGAGRTEAARAIFGADPKDKGTIRLAGRDLTIRSPVDAIREGIAYLSEDRKRYGLAVTMKVKDNVTMANMAAVSDRFGFIRDKAEREASEKYVKSMSIKTPSIHQIAKNLSGGNQQKVVISKWLFRNSRVLFFDEPTRGIDVGAKFAIYQLLDQLAGQGIGVVFISSELPEILGITDRVVVFHEGEITGILDTRETDQEEIMAYASGVRVQRPDILETRRGIGD